MVGFLRAVVEGYKMSGSVCVCSHGATFVLVCVRFFEAEPLLGSIFLQVGELFAVDGSATLPETHKHIWWKPTVLDFKMFFSVLLYTLTAKNITDILLLWIMWIHWTR